MKNIPKLILISLLMFILSTIGMTYLYVLFDNLMEINLKNILTILIQVGLIGGIIFTIIFLLIYYLIKRIKNIWLLTISLIGFFIFFIFLAYWFFLAMMYYRLEDSQSFLSILLQVL
jgi:hypothetical protein